MNFIHCFTKELKDELIKFGYKLISDNNNFYIFENNLKLRFDFNKVNKTQFMFSNKMTF